MPEPGDEVLCDPSIGSHKRRKFIGRVTSVKGEGDAAEVTVAVASYANKRAHPQRGMTRVFPADKIQTIPKRGIR